MKIYKKNGRLDYTKTTEELIADSSLIFLLETYELNTADNFIFNDEKYSFCSYSPKEDIAVVDILGLKDLKEYDYQFTDEITCPYCGHTNSESWDEPDESDDEVCLNCGGEFAYTREVAITYYSEKVEEPYFQEVD